MSVVRMVVVALLLTTLAFGASPFAQEPPVKITRISASVGQAPLWLRFTVTIDRHPDNRAWCYGFFEPGLEEPTIKHCEDLVGDKSAKFYTKEEKHVDEGEYVVIAYVFRRSVDHPLKSLPVHLTVGERFPGS